MRTAWAWIAAAVIVVSGLAGIKTGIVGFFAVLLIFIFIILVFAAVFIAMRSGEILGSAIRYTVTQSNNLPLSFYYLPKNGICGRVTLINWIDKGDLIVGTPLDHNLRIHYRKDRITGWQDLSWKQLAGYRPPVGSPLDPMRLPK